MEEHIQRWGVLSGRLLEVGKKEANDTGDSNMVRPVPREVGLDGGIRSGCEGVHPLFLGTWGYGYQGMERMGRAHRCEMEKSLVGDGAERRLGGKPDDELWDANKVAARSLRTRLGGYEA